MKRTLLAIITFLFLTFSKNVKASHSMGIDISYRHLFGETYEITIGFYRDCAGSTSPSSVTIALNSTLCTQVTSVSLPLIGPADEITSLCPAELFNSSCNGGGIPGSERYIYQGVVTLPAKCADWNLSYTHCCRNAAITNLLSPSSQTIYVEATIDNSGSLNNSSPIFTTVPVPYICDGQLFNYNHGAVETDGDSLVYTLVDPKDGPYPSAGIGHVAPTTATYPIEDTRGFNDFNTATGSFGVIPNGNQVAVMSVLIEEYRNGVLIGSITRDLQVIINSCTNDLPQDALGGIQNLTNAVLTNSTTIETCPDVPITFDIVFDDVNSSDVLTLLHNASMSLPGATVTITGTNPSTASISWTPTVGEVGLHNLTFTVQDDACPFLGTNVFGYSVEVMAQTYVDANQSYCVGGGPVDITASGGSSFTWSVLAGDLGSLTCNPCNPQTVSPSSNTTYVVVSNLSAMCKNKDTIVINNVPDFTLTMGADQNICKYSSATITGTATPGAQGPFIYTWTPDYNLSDNTISNPTADPLSTVTYTVSVESANGCTIENNVTVNVVGEAPRGEIVFDTDSLCLGSSANLSVEVIPNCGITAEPCVGSIDTAQIGTATTTSTTYSPFYTHPSAPYSNRKQWLYTANELNDAGFVRGAIQAIALDVTVDGGDVTNMDLSIGCTGYEDYTTLDPFFITGLTNVKASFTHNPFIGWNVITFDNPYNWDGVSNLVVEFCVPIQATGGVISNVRYTNQPLAMSMYKNSNGVDACIPTGIDLTNRVNLKFIYCDATPAAITYAWSPSGGTNASAMVSPGSTTTYTVNLDDGSGCIGTVPLDITVAPAYTLDVTPDTTVCFGDIFNLRANPSMGGSYSYEWTPNYLVSDPNISNPSVDGQFTQQYNVRVSNGGCIKLDSLIVNVSGQGILAEIADDTICSSDLISLTSEIVQYCNVTTDACTGAVSTTTVGTATSSSGTYAPFYQSNRSKKIQYIYTVAELNTAGFVGTGKISSLAFDVSTLGATTPNITGMTIRMGCTSLDVFITENFNNVPTIVKNSGTVTPTLGWFTIPFDNEYLWDGVSNIIIEFCYDDIQVGATSNVRSASIGTGIERTLYKNLTAAGACSLDIGTLTTNRPNMRFTHCSIVPAVTYTWTPDPTLVTPTSSSTNGNPVNTTTYTVSIDDGSCVSTSSIVAYVDSSTTIVATTDNLVPCNGTGVQLTSTTTGSPTPLPITFNPCGLNANLNDCSNGSYQQQVGTGVVNSTPSSTRTYHPFYQYNNSHKVEYLFSATELIAAGLTAGSISALDFNLLAKNTTAPFIDFTIKISCTTLDGYPTSGNFFTASNTVYGPTSFSTPVGLGWFSIPFVNNFDWDGTSGLVMSICYNNPTDPNLMDIVEFAFGYPLNNCLRLTASSNVCPTLTPSSTEFKNRPNVRFTMCNPAPNPFVYSWSVISGPPLSNTAIANPTFTSDGNGAIYEVTLTGGRCPMIDTVTMNACPLGIDILKFTAMKIEKGAQLDWTLTNANELSSIEIQSKGSSNNFEHIGNMDIAPSSTQKNFNYIDGKLRQGKIYYRLKLKHRNGEITYSDIRLVHFFGNGAVSVYPNPQSQGQSIFVLLKTDDSIVRLDLVDVSGKEIRHQYLNKVDFTQVFEIDTRDLAVGTYFYRVVGNSLNATGKIQIMN